MPRPRCFRRVWFEPNVTYFKPAGIRKSELAQTTLTVDEFEAIRLKDLEGIDQIEAAKKMQISQPTFHRTLISARKKIADALVNGKAIRIFGGNYKMIRSPGRGRGFGRGMPTSCICPSCGYEQEKQRGTPCLQIKCPKCGTPLVGKP